VLWTQDGPIAVLMSNGTTSVPSWQAPSSAMSLISSTVLGSAAASITFSSIPGTYNHLQLVAMGTSSRANSSDWWAVQVNGDTTANNHRVAGVTDLNGGAPAGLYSLATSWTANGSSAGPADMPASTGTAGVAGRIELWLPCYALTTYMKTGRWESGKLDGALPYEGFNDLTVHWNSTAAITSLKLFPLNGPNLTAGSAAYLYGVT
jgi:hypothetical protein